MRDLFCFLTVPVISLKHATQKIKNTKQFPQLLCHPNGIYYTFILYLGIVKNILSSNDLRQVGDRWLFHLSQVINFFPIFFWPETFPSHQPKLTPSQDLIVSEKTAVRFSESHMWWVSRKHDRTWHGSCRSQVHMQNCIALLLLLST